VHVCAACGRSWQCFQKLEARSKTCKVDIAAKSNKQGPFCELCIHIEMARRHAQIRGYAFEVTINGRPWPPTKGVHR
jgi:hypothetical protein